MILNSQASLQLGAIPFLIGQQSRSDVATDWWVEALAEGATLGNPVPVTAAIQSLLADGSLVITRNHDNREVSFQLRVNAPDGTTLAEAERALFLECSRLNELFWTPPDGYAATTVFRVITSSLEHQFDDFDELRLMRAYTIRLTCEPFGRSVNQVTVPALVAAAGSDTQINACDSTTGWSSSTLGKTAVTFTADTAQKVEGTASLKFVADPKAYSREQYSGSTYKWSLDQAATLSGLSLDFTTRPYLAVTFFTGASSSGGEFYAYADGVELKLISTKTRAANWLTCYFVCNDSSVSSLTFRRTMDYYGTFDPGAGGSESAWVPAEWCVRLDDVRYSGSSPVVSSTGRESTRLIEVQGSARTQASIEVTHPTAGLGDVLLYTNPALSATGYTPDLQRWRVSATAGGVSTDPATISGVKVLMADATPAVWEFPADPLPRDGLNDGGYLLAARVVASGGGSVQSQLSYTVKTKIGSTLLGSTTYTSAPLPDGTYITLLGGVTLPPTDVPAGSSALVQLSMTNPSYPSQSVLIDELWALAMGDDSALAIVSCGGTGTPTIGTANNALFIDPPTIDRPAPSLWVGTSRDNSYNAAASVWTVPTLVPPMATWFIANTGGANPSALARYFPRWHTHACQLEP